MIANRILIGLNRSRPTASLALRRAKPHLLSQRPAFALPPGRRTYASRTAVDEKIEEIQELYGTAKDEFDIAIEETEKQTVYAEEDRKACREELDKLNAVYKEVLEGQDKDMADEIRKRIGQRIRELVTAVERLEEMAQNQD